MKALKTLLIVFMATLCSHGVFAQKVDEIINKYFENIGGKAKWQALEGIKKIAKMNLQGMDLPITKIEMKDGRQVTFLEIQGMTFFQNVYDGNILWSTSQMTQKPEKSTVEATENFKSTIGHYFPDPLLNYTKNGYKAELVGTETIDGKEAFKIKLTKKPTKIDDAESAAFYYFDTQDYLPVLMEVEVKDGPAKGMISQKRMSDYQEVNGMKFPFLTSFSVKGQPGTQNITITDIEINPQVDASLFVFPGN